MADLIDQFFGRIGFTGTTIKTVQFVIGAGLVAFSIYKYRPDNMIVSVLGILFGAYLILKVIE